MVLAMRDIKERKLAEQALIDSEARYRMLAENIGDVLLRYDADGRISYVSPSVRQWGYEPTDFVGKALAGDTSSIRTISPHRPAQGRHARGRGRQRRSNCVILRADSKWTDRCCPASRSGLAREKLGVVLILRDINARKAAEAALIESEIRYRMLADNTSDIIQRFDADGVVEYISPSVRQLGYEPEFFLGRPTALVVDREDLPAVARRRAEMLSGQTVAPLESRVHAADGRTVWLESRPSPILGEDGNLLGVVNVMRDVTERKNAEIALQDLNLELRRVARASALGAFAARRSACSRSTSPVAEAGGRQRRGGAARCAVRRPWSTMARKRSGHAAARWRR